MTIEETIRTYQDEVRLEYANSESIPRQLYLVCVHLAIVELLLRITSSIDDLFHAHADAKDKANVQERLDSHGLQEVRFAKIQDDTLIEILTRLGEHQAVLSFKASLELVK